MKVIKIVLIIFFTFILAQTEEVSQYDHNIAIDMLYYAKASYCDSQQILEWNGPTFQHHPQMESITVINNKKHNSQMYMGYDKQRDQIVAAFRGSSNIKNWFDNLKFFKTKYPACHKCEVHIGFYKAWLSIQEEVHNTYLSLRKSYPSAKFVISGHSLGATQAQLCALYFSEIGVKVDLLYHFGSPRVGNKAFSIHGHSLIPHNVLVVHHRDPVPHVPKAQQGYRRINTEVFYEGNKPHEYKWCSSEPGYEHKKCSNKYFFDISIKDHLHYLGISTGCDDLSASQEIYE